MINSDQVRWIYYEWSSSDYDFFSYTSIESEILCGTICLVVDKQILWVKSLLKLNGRKFFKIINPNGMESHWSWQLTVSFRQWNYSPIPPFSTKPIRIKGAVRWCHCIRSLDRFPPRALWTPRFTVPSTSITWTPPYKQSQLRSLEDPIQSEYDTHRKGHKTDTWHIMFLRFHVRVMELGDRCFPIQWTHTEEERIKCLVGTVNMWIRPTWRKQTVRDSSRDSQQN